MAKDWMDDGNMDWAVCDMEEDEILSHVVSMREMTEAGKVKWKLLSYSPPYFFIRNPFVEDMEASLSQRLLIEGTTTDGRMFRYQVMEMIHVPSGLCDVEIEEKHPATEYEIALSSDKQYEYLTLQKDVLNVYKGHPVVLFARTVAEQVRSENFRNLVKDPSRAFSAEPLPAALAALPIVRKAQELFTSCDAIAFHELVLSNVMRENLGIKD